MISNPEKTSKLISYWLRHKPEDGNLTLDKFGWAAIDDVLRALDSNSIGISTSDLIDLNNSFDKIRWHIDLENNRIKATHGHSIEIKQEIQPSIPNEILYHGTASKNIESILNQGIKSLNRQFVHLSESVELAAKVAERHGQPFIIEIETEKLLNNGWEFFKTEENVWLTKDIDKDYISFPPWDLNLNPESKERLLKELKLEVSEKHPLFEKIDELEVIGSFYSSDDILLKNKISGSIYVVHLTFNRNELYQNYPKTKEYKNFSEWIDYRLVPDQSDWF